MLYGLSSTYFEGVIIPKDAASRKSAGVACGIVGSSSAFLNEVCAIAEAETRDWKAPVSNLKSHAIEDAKLKAASSG
jgi:hypothetical protein